MAAPTQKGDGPEVFGTASTLTPTNDVHVAGDILIVFVGSSANASVTPTHSISDGTWALITSGVITTGTVRARISAYWKRATSSSEGNLTVTLTPTGATACHHAAWCSVFQGCVASGTPFEGANNAGAAATNAITVTRGATAADRLSVIALHHADNVGTGVTEDHADAYVQEMMTDSAVGIDGLSYYANFGPIDDNESVTMTVTGGGTGVGIAGLAFALIGTTSTTHDLTGSGDQDWAPSGSFQVDRHLTGAGTTTFTLASTTEVDRHLTGAGTTTFTLASTTEVDRVLAGLLAALTFIPGGGPSTAVYHDLTGTLAALTHALAGTPEHDVHLSGSLATLTASLAGGFEVDRLLTGVCTQTYLPTGDLAVQHNFTLTGAAALVFGVTGFPVLDLPPIIHQRYRFGYIEPTWKRYYGRSVYRR